MQGKVKLILFLYLALLSAAATAQNVWRLVSPDGKDTSLLVGTIHYRLGETNLPDSLITQHLRYSQKLVMEVALTAEIYNNILFLQVSDPAYRLDNVLTAEEYKKLNSHLKQVYGLNLKYFQNLPPVFIWLVMNHTGVSTDNRPYIDEYYHNLAKEQEYEIVGLETFAAQMETLDTLPMPVQAGALKSLINRKPEATDQPKVVQLYNQGKYKKLCKALLAKFPKEIAGAWVNHRNTKLLPDLAGQLRTQPCTVLIASTQLHGKKGLLKLLQKHGFEVSKVDY